MEHASAHHLKLFTIILELRSARTRPGLFRQSKQNVPSAIFKALTNRFLRVETVVMVNGYLPLSLSFLLQLQRDTLTANSFFRKGGQGWTWKFSSLAAAIWDGDERRNIAVHCWAQRVVPFSLKQRAIKAHQSEHFLSCQIERPHFILLQESFRSSSQMCSSCVLFNSKRLSGDVHGAPEKRKQCSTANH